MAEVQSSLAVPWEEVEKEEKDFSKEGWGVEPSLTMLLVVLVEVEVLTVMEEVQEEEEDTLEEAVGIMNMIPVEAVADLIMLVKIDKTNVAINHLAMVR